MECGGDHFGEFSVFILDREEKQKGVIIFFSVILLFCYRIGSQSIPSLFFNLLIE